MHDLFISYADEDAAWVEGYLLDVFDAIGIKYHDEAAFELGVPRLVSFEKAIKESKRVVLVLSPEYIGENTNQFFDLMAGQYGLETSTWPVIPLILRETALPPRLAMLTGLDATDPEQWDDVVARLCETLGTPPPSFDTALPSCPYPGMVPYREHDSKRFFGRDAEIEEIIQRLRNHPFLAVVGPSGSGKSSLVFAGVVPRLRGSRAFGSGDWLVTSMRPGSDPFLGYDVENRPVRMMNSQVEVWKDSGYGYFTWTRIGNIKDDFVSTYALSPNVSQFATGGCATVFAYEGAGCEGGLINLWDLSKTATPRTQLASAVVPLAENTNTRKMFLEANNEYIGLFDVNNGILTRLDTDTLLPIDEYQFGNPSSYENNQIEINSKQEIAIITQGSHTIEIQEPAVSANTLTLVHHDAEIKFVTFSPNSKLMLSLDVTNQAVLWETTTWSVLNTFDFPNGLPALSNNGFAASGTGGELTILNTYTGETVVQSKWEYPGVNALSFGVDDNTLLVAPGPGFGLLVLWDIPSGQPRATIPVLSFLNKVVMSQDGSSIYVSDFDTTVRLTLDSTIWIQEACQIANRNLTQAEWNRYLGSEYHKTCPNYPEKEDTP